MLESDKVDSFTQPDDLLNLSVPFSYMAVQVVPNDGKSHTVQVYSDITAEWVSGSDSALVNWTTTTHGAAVIHKAQLQQQTLFDDPGDRIQREPSSLCRSRRC